MSHADLNHDKIADVVGGLTTQFVILYPIASTLLTAFFYGLYVPIFGISIYLLGQGDFTARKLYMTCTILLFLISTCTVVVEVVGLIDGAMRQFTAVQTRDYMPYIRYLIHNDGKTATISILYFIPFLANIVSETMLIHRCYIIWGHSKRVGIPLIIFSLLGSVLGLFGGILAALALSENSVDKASLSEGILLIGAIVSTFLNMIVTALTAGRIWWVDRESKTFRGSLPDKKLQYAARIVTESGLIYPLMMTLNLIVVNSTGEDSPPPLDIYPSVVCAAGIAPSLIIIRGQVAKILDKLRPRHMEVNLGISEIRYTGGNEYQMEPLHWPPRNSLNELDREAEKVSPTVPLLHSPD
ncbi:hypothetical protein E1B28_009179 [Marasmius oreades]|uniref:Uncharacterized protein n=1 Tax=Marasmius oreades TaxID=181124 RepID=A0A9P7UU19_9AGAR|nr:uncharacterized protein E1B28_009179 [Marasmius oreades]KAG7092866.1 hypothetical protein E1B28_009179 [Marasmius oreades]